MHRRSSQCLDAGRRSFLALPAMIGDAALHAHDEREQRLSGRAIGVMDEERPAKALGQLDLLGAVRFELRLVLRAQTLHAVGDPALAAVGGEEFGAVPRREASLRPDRRSR